MLDKKVLSAEDFIIGLAASGMAMDEVAQIIAASKKGMDIRYKNRVDASWKPTELKKLRGRLIFGRWQFVGGGMFRQSWDGSISQDVKFFYDRECTVPVENCGASFSMLEAIAEKAVANCDGEVSIKVVLTSDQICALAGKGGVK